MAVGSVYWNDSVLNDSNGSIGEIRGNKLWIDENIA